MPSRRTREVPQSDMVFRIDQDVELLGMEPSIARPEDYLWQYISVPPTCIRPTVQQEDATNEDDLSVKLSEIIYCCSLIEASLRTGQGIALVMVSRAGGVPTERITQPRFPLFDRNNGSS